MNKKNNINNKFAFTLVELLVVIAIIGIISTLAVVSLTNARKSARDAKRIADIKQIQTALELYYQDNGQYPSTITDSIATSGNIYMQSFPTAPTPADGDCTDTNNAYTYTVSGTENSSYSLTFCLGSQTNDLSAGVKEAIPGGTIDFISPPTPWACGDNLIDSRDNSEYPTVEIGTQCWMKKNLAYLPEVHSNAQFQTQGANSLPAYGVYGYNGSDVSTAKIQANYTTYGVLYNHFAVVQVNICPTDWHVPSTTEFTALTDYLGGASIAGGKMKETGTTHWLSPNDGSNESGFTALPAGGRSTNGSFSNIYTNANFWSSSINETYGKYGNISYYTGANFTESNVTRVAGYSVRCLKD